MTECSLPPCWCVDISACWEFICTLSPSLWDSHSLLWYFETIEENIVQASYLTEKGINNQETQWLLGRHDPLLGSQPMSTHFPWESVDTFMIWESLVPWNISSSDNHSTIKASFLWILKSFSNLLDNLLLKCNHEFLYQPTPHLLINPLVRAKMNKKNGAQGKPWGKKHMFRGWASGRRTEEGGTEAKSHLLHKKARHCPDPHVVWLGYCSMSLGEGMEVGDRRWLI